MVSSTSKRPGCFSLCSELVELVVSPATLTLKLFRLDWGPLMQPPSASGATFVAFGKMHCPGFAHEYWCGRFGVSAHILCCLERCCLLVPGCHEHGQDAAHQNVIAVETSHPARGKATSDHHGHALKSAEGRDDSAVSSDCDVPVCEKGEKEV